MKFNEMNSVKFIQNEVKKKVVPYHNMCLYFQPD